MTTPSTYNGQEHTTEATLCVAVELSEKHWKLGLTTGAGQKPRERGLTARHQERRRDEIAQAQRRFSLPDTPPVVRCYAAGRAGVWLHRFLLAHGITTHVVASSALEGSRRQRRAKSDGLDVRKFLRMLSRYHGGERQVWHVGNAPSGEAEEQRHRHRDLETLKQERGDTTRRIQGVRRSQGWRGTPLSTLPEQLDALRLWDGAPIPPGLRRRLLRG